jgi:hypothetical protein
MVPILEWTLHALMLFAAAAITLWMAGAIYYDVCQGAKYEQIPKIQQLLTRLGSATLSTPLNQRAWPCGPSNMSGVRGRGRIILRWCRRRASAPRACGHSRELTGRRLEYSSLRKRFSPGNHRTDR